MSETNTYSGRARIDNDTRELILNIRKKKWRYLLIAALIGAYFFYIFKYKVLDYSATATFFVNDHSIISASSLDLRGENLAPGDNYNRIFELVNSAQTQKHLIKTFDLLKHYGIDTTDEFYFQKAIAIVRSNIVVTKSQANSISVTVKDRYRYLPADMANEIVSFIEKLNQDFYINNIQSKIELSQAYVKELESENKIKSDGIDSIIKKMNGLITSGRLNEKGAYELLLQQQKLNEIIINFKNSSNDLINSQKLYNLSLQTLNFRTFPTITVLQMAMPAFRSIAYTAMMYSLLAMVLVFLVLILQGFLFIHYKDYIMLILTGK